jgi:uncharacterized protein (DUF3820 family)
VHGREIRDTPNSMGLMLWFSMLTLPVGAIGFLLGLMARCTRQCVGKMPMTAQSLRHAADARRAGGDPRGR